MEYDKRITHKTTREFNKYSFSWFISAALTVAKVHSWLRYEWVYRKMTHHINCADAVLSVGGDNYSLDYGLPHLFVGLDDVVLRRNKPLIIWCASVGPFSDKPKYEKKMKNHLKKVTAIFAREPETIEYLAKLGIVDNVYRVADPAFMMSAIEPDENKKIKIKEKAIGINLSPLMANYVTNGNMIAWVDRATQIISEISKKFSRPIYLIPHVTGNKLDDYEFMKKVMNNLSNNDEIYLIPPIYNAAETKWIISKMAVFAGARTHSTIAAMSSLIPTLSFAYSIKAKGINQDVFGHEKFCIPPKNLNADTVIRALNDILNNRPQIIKHMESEIPKVKLMTIRSGEYLKNILEKGATPKGESE